MEPNTQFIQYLLKHSNLIKHRCSERERRKRKGTSFQVYIRKDNSTKADGCITLSGGVLKMEIKISVQV